jgi:hypothetical protein
LKDDFIIIIIIIILGQLQIWRVVTCGMFTFEGAAPLPNNSYILLLLANSIEIANKRNDIATVARGNIVRPNQLVEIFYQTQRIAFHHFLMLLNTISNSK